MSEFEDIIRTWTQSAIDTSMTQMPVKSVTNEVFNRAKDITFNSIQMGIEMFVRNREPNEVYDEFDTKHAPYNQYVIDRIQFMIDELNSANHPTETNQLAQLILENATSIFEEKYSNS